jgi:dihydropteroate synthase
LNCRGRLLDLSRPQVMGILNLTPDSFSDGGKYNELASALPRVEQMLQEGATIIDIGGYSSRPFADDVPEEDEWNRIAKITQAVIREFPEAIISIDTFRTGVAEKALDLGAHIINDISAGLPDTGMMQLVSSYRDVPYIMMHMKGNPRSMQLNPNYDNILEEIWDFFVDRINEAREAGIKDIVLDPGYGFGKSLLHNYQLVGELERFTHLDFPILTGISRKSMLYKFFDTEPGDVLEIATALHLKLLEQGSRILRVHDVKEAVRIVNLYNYLEEHGIV